MDELKLSAPKLTASKAPRRAPRGVRRNAKFARRAVGNTKPHERLFIRKMIAEKDPAVLEILGL